MRGGEEFQGWSFDRYLRVATVEALHNLTYAFVKANSKSSPQQPTPIPTPDRNQRKSENLFATQLAQQFESLKDN